MRRGGARFDTFDPGDGAHRGAGVVPGDLDLIVQHGTRVASFSPPQPLHDLGHIGGATRLAQASLQLEQRGFQAAVLAASMMRSFC